MFKQIYTTEMSGSKKVIEKRFMAINKKKKHGIITAMSVLFAVIIVCGAMLLNGYVSNNAKIYKETKREVASSKKTIGDYAEEMNIELGDLLEIFGLPADLSADTDEETVSEMIPLSKIAQASGMDLEELKQELGFPDSVTGDTTWGEAVEAMLPGSKSVDYVYWMDFKSKLQKIKNKMW